MNEKHFITLQFLANLLNLKQGVVGGSVKMSLADNRKLRDVHNKILTAIIDIYGADSDEIINRLA